MRTLRIHNRPRTRRSDTHSYNTACAMFFVPKTRCHSKVWRETLTAQSFTATAVCMRRFHRAAFHRNCGVQTRADAATAAYLINIFHPAVAAAAALPAAVTIPVLLVFMLGFGVGALPVTLAPPVVHI